MKTQKVFEQAHANYIEKHQEEEQQDLLLCFMDRISEGVKTLRESETSAILDLSEKLEKAEADRDAWRAEAERWRAISTPNEILYEGENGTRIIKERKKELKSASITFKNLTPAQAETFSEWFCGQGEQDADIWFEDACEDPTPQVDCSRPDEIDADGNVTCYCK